MAERLLGGWFAEQERYNSVWENRVLNTVVGGCPAADTDTIYLQERFAPEAEGRQGPDRAEKDTVEEDIVKWSYDIYLLSWIVLQ